MTGRLADSYRRDNDKEREIDAYLPLVQRVVGKMMLYGNGLLERDDMFSLGVIGLLHALEKYDPSKGVRFEAYAISRIRGAILDELRKLSWHPRTVLDTMKRITAVQDKLAGSEREWDYGVIADELGESEKQVRRAVSHFNAGMVLSFDELAFGDDIDGQTRYDLVADSKAQDPQQDLLKKERTKILTGAIKQLDQRDQLMLALYYQEELTLKEIGKILGITEGRVCQIHARALARLRILIGEQH